MTDTQNILAERREAAKKITMRRTLYAAGAGLIPVPVLDAAALLGVQIYMVRDIARAFDVEFKEQRVRSIITVLVGDVAAVGLFKFVPGLGWFFGGASAAAAGAAATYALGQIFSRHFAEGGTLLDFDAEKSKKAFQKEFEKGKKVVAKLKKKATGKADSLEPDDRELLESNKALHAEILELKKEVAALRKQPKQAKKSKPKGEHTNLQLVEGIGPKIAAALKAGGIADLKKLAASTPKQIKAILDKAKGNFSLAAADSWPEQANLAVKGDMEALKALQDKLTGGR